MLQVFGHPVATCCELKIELVGMPRSNIVARTWPNDYNIMQNPQMLHEKCDHFQIWANNTQHVETQRPNARNMLHPTMLRSFGRGFKCNDTCISAVNFQAS